ncbi:MAG TPA: IS200/IS605 family transposase [bacterium]
MPHKVYSSIYIHVVWHTKDNAPAMTPEYEKVIHSIIVKKTAEFREVQILKIGETENHMHVAAKIPPTLQISAWIGQIKGATSFAVKRAFNSAEFAWQGGYGVVSFRASDSVVISQYIARQKQHHATGKLSDELEKTE